MRYSHPVTCPPDGPLAFIGRNIRALRRQRRWTQSELGQKLSRRKLSRQAIGWIESGRNTDLETIADIAGALGVAVETLTSRAALHYVPAIPPQAPREIARELLARPMESWSEIAERERRYRSTEVIGVLLEDADREFDNDPLRCRAICAAATQLVERLPRLDEPGIPELRMQAWKDLAHVTSRLGDNEESLSYLERAEIAAAQSANPAHQKAIVDFERAIVFSLMERFDEARKRLLAAHPVLERFDRRRFFMILHAEAVLEAMSGDPGAASTRLEQLIAEAPSWNFDDAEMSRLYDSAGYALHRAGQTARAAKYVRLSAEMHQRSSSGAEMPRDIAREASLTAALGDPIASFAKHEEARRKLIALGLHRDLVEVDFHYLLAKCAAGADPRELHEICSRLASAAIAAKLPVTACQAIAWLQQISERLTPDSVVTVRRFVEESESRPDLPFQAPVV